MAEHDLDGALTDIGAWLDATRPYHGDLILVGGYAPVFYRQHTAISAGGTPLFSGDADFVTPQNLCRRGDATITELSERASFRTIQVPGVRPGTWKTKYEHERHQKGAAPVYIECIASLEKSGVDRRGREVTDRLVQPGLNVQTVRFVELLRPSPLVVDAQGFVALGLDRPTPVQVAHPMGFILQKARIRDRRPPDKQAKDMAYITDVARITRRMWPEMRDWLNERFDDEAVSPKWLVDAAGVLASGFSDPGSFGPVETAQVYEGQQDQLDAERAYLIVSRMIQEVGIGNLAQRSSGARSR